MQYRRLIIWSIIPLLIFVAVSTIWFIRSQFVSCTTWETNVSNEYGRKVMVIDKACAGIASSEGAAIELTNAHGKRVPVLEYGSAYSFAKHEGDATPVIRWADKNTLTISIKMISTLKYRADKVDGVRIDVHIGEILYKLDAPTAPD